MSRHGVSLAPLARALAGALILILALALPATAQVPGAGSEQSAEDTQTAAPEAGAPAARAQALIEVLRDDEARAALIAELERLAATAPEAAADAPAAAEPPAEEEPSFSRQLAETTKSTAEAVAARAETLYRQLSAAPRTFSALGDADFAVLGGALRNLALTIIATYAVFLLLRLAAHRLYYAMGRAAAEAGLWRTLLLLIGSTVADGIVVVIAWAAGYAIALTVFGEFGQVALLQTLYLNAFLVVQLAKVVLRAVLSPTTSDLRLMPLTDGAARYLDRWLTTLIALVGYGQILVVPVVNQEVSWAAGRALGSRPSRSSPRW